MEKALMMKRMVHVWPHSSLQAKDRRPGSGFSSLCLHTHPEVAHSYQVVGREPEGEGPSDAVPALEPRLGKSLGSGLYS